MPIIQTIKTTVTTDTEVSISESQVLDSARSVEDYVQEHMTRLILPHPGMIHRIRAWSVQVEYHHDDRDADSR